LSPSVTTPIFIAAGATARKRGKLLADYDSFWLSIGGEKQDSGNFMLPLVMPRKPMEEIASKNAPNIAAATSCWIA
jgi:hypothetical protein